MDETRPDTTGPDTEEAPGGFFVRWVMPVLLVMLIVLILVMLARVSMPVIEAGQEVPEDHFSTACWVCHRSR